MKRTLWLLALLLVSLGPVPVGAAGLIIVHDPDFWVPPPRILPPPRPVPPPRIVPPATWAPLEVNQVQANVRIKDQIAVTSIEQEFYNPNSRQLEGTFLFPVPAGAQINKFTMEINGRQVEAELLAADKAKGIYEDIVRKLKDPALLEYAGRDLFKVRIFPIEPHAKKRITLAYSQVLKADAGLVNFVFPLNTEKFSAKPVKNVSLKVELETKHPLQSIYSPSHKVEVKRDGPRRAVVGFEAADVKPDADFQLLYASEQDDVGLNLMTFKSPGEDGYFLLLVAPGSELKQTRVIPKDVTFVLDTSGSMAGAKLEQAKKALAFCVENLNENDRFEILRFSTEVEPLFDGLVEASADQRRKAQAWIKDLKPIGGTAIDEALRQALDRRPERGRRPYIVVFLTDGRPTIGVTGEDQIVGNVTKRNDANTRVFCFGIGTDVNTHLLDKITEQTKAFSQYVLPEEDLEVKVSSFFTKIKEPVLANPRLSFPDSVRVTKVYPSPLPDLFKGEQLILAGRYSGKGDGAIKLEGTVDGDVKTFAYDVRFPDEGCDHEFIPRLWATRRVGYLLDEIRLRGENAELKDEVTELARQYGIVTPYTAYLIMEDEGRRGVAQNLRSFSGLERDVRVREETASLYSRFKADRSGDAAVAGAQSSQAFKQADRPVDAIAEGNTYALRPQAVPAAPAQRGAAGPGVTLAPLPGAAGRGLGGGSAPLVVNEPMGRVVQSAQQTRYVGGRSFFQNGAQWIDSQVQQRQNAKRVRVQFDSPEYFALVKQHPEARPWLALGRQVQFVLHDTVYEVYE